MLIVIVIACALIAITAVIHTVGIAVLIRQLRKYKIHATSRFWPIFWLLVEVTWWLIFIHLIEIFVWAVFYRWWECVPNIYDSFYFSAVTYATIGYGDIVLAKPWRVLSAIEGLTGALMCGLSTGMFFSVVNQLLRGPGARSGPEESLT